LLAAVYRFLDTVSHAKDVVQETYLRWIEVDQTSTNDAVLFFHESSPALVLIC